jgi:hypothetical protein
MKQPANSNRPAVSMRAARTLSAQTAANRRPTVGTRTKPMRFRKVSQRMSVTNSTTVTTPSLSVATASTHKPFSNFHNPPSIPHVPPGWNTFACANNRSCLA